MISLHISYRCDGDELARVFLIRDDLGTLRIEPCEDGNGTEDALHALEPVLREALDAVERRRVLGRLWYPADP